MLASASIRCLLGRQQQRLLATADYTQHPTYRAGVPRVRPVDPECNALDGQVRWSPSKSLWYAGMTVSGIVGAVATFDAAHVLTDAAIFLGTTGVSVLFGHSLGMHRRFIHAAYDCPKWFEYLGVHLGTLMGIEGPLGMLKAHDLRDWAQRQPAGHCHPYYGQQSSFWRDAYWQMHCSLRLSHPPDFVVEPRIADDRVIAWMQRTWMLQQLPLAALLWATAGWSAVFWGVCLRVGVSVHGHFWVGWYAHNPGPIQSRAYHVADAAIQGYNVQGFPFVGAGSRLVQRLVAVMTAGECYHNNHHAFPGSAKLAVQPHEIDIGWSVLRLLARLGVVNNLKQPQDLPSRPELVAINQ